MRYAILLTSITASSALAGGLPADVTFISNRTDFNASLTASNLEDFESESVGDLALPNAFDSGLNAALTSGDVVSYIDFQNFNGFQNTVGARHYLAFGRNGIDSDGSSIPQTGAYTVSFTFGGDAIKAIGFDLSGFQPESAADGFNVTTLNNGQILSDFFFPSGQEFGESRFYGFLADNSFDEFRINFPVLGTDGVADYVAFDGVAWGVPTPGAASLLTLAAIGASRRRRSN